MLSFYVSFHNVPRITKGLPNPCFIMKYLNSNNEWINCNNIEDTLETQQVTGFFKKTMRNPIQIPIHSLSTTNPNNLLIELYSKQGSVNRLIANRFFSYSLLERNNFYVRRLLTSLQGTNMSLLCPDRADAHSRQCFYYLGNIDEMNICSNPAFDDTF